MAVLLTDLVADLKSITTNLSTMSSSVAGYLTDPSTGSSLPITQTLIEALKTDNISTELVTERGAIIGFEGGALSEAFYTVESVKRGVALRGFTKSDFYQQAITEYSKDPSKNLSIEGSALNKIRGYSKEQVI